MHNVQGTPHTQALVVHWLAALLLTCVAVPVPAGILEGSSLVGKELEQLNFSTVTTLPEPGAVSCVVSRT